MKKENFKDNYLSVYNKCYSFRDNKKCAKQRAIKGYCYRDVFAIDSWFLKVMPRMLEELNNTGDLRGYPNQIIVEFYQNNKDRIPVSENEFVNGFYRDKYEELYHESSNWCDNRWTEILNRMIFLFDESDDEKCTMKNEFEVAYYQAQQEFRDRYGLDGEKLLTDSEKEEIKKWEVEHKDEGKLCIIHYMEELPQYKEINEKYKKRNNEIYNYQQQCKHEALNLFVKYFDALWW